MNIETILSPAELSQLAGRDWRGTACVVFDILRATSTFVTALNHGATAIIPVSEISEAIARRREQPEFLLAGERDGVKIRAAQSGGVDFDFGNSPREFRPEAVRGKTIVSTTTNGTRALRACAGSPCVAAAAFLNLTATAKFLRTKKFSHLLLVCAGTGESVADEDVLAAGALIELLQNSPSVPRSGEGENNYCGLDAASEMARQQFATARTKLTAVIGNSQNGRRLLANPDLCADVAFCAQRDVYDLVAVMSADGALRTSAA